MNGGGQSFAPRDRLPAIPDLWFRWLRSLGLLAFAVALLSRLEAVAIPKPKLG